MNDQESSAAPDVPAGVKGTPVVAGVAWAPAIWVHRPSPPPGFAPDVPQEGRDAEHDAFDDAAKAVSDSLMDRALQAQGDAADVLMVASSLATDRSFRKLVDEHIATGSPAIQAVAAATEEFVRRFEAAGGLMAERVTDLVDVRDRIIARLRGEPEPGLPHTDTPAVLLADDLSPADTAGLDPELFIAIVTEGGGPTSHTSIIARQLGLPCIVAAAGLSGIPEGTHVLVDGGTGIIRTGVSEAVAAEAIRRDAERQAAVASWKPPAQTSDGTRVELLANVPDAAVSRTAAEKGAEGIGLFRTEFLFLDAAMEPTIYQQEGAYADVLAAFPNGKVVVRTLDAGSDKPIAYVTPDDEPNPALGVRGLRTARQHPAVLERQLDAIAQAAHQNPGTDTWVMAPMVATVAEARWFTDLVRSRAKGSGGMKAGIMIEIPAAAVLIDQFMEVVDFVSLGTNDLAQYAMAADRTCPDVAELTDPWQPAVLELIRMAAAGGQRAGKPVGVCGEAAADPLLACVLLGMGVTSLSMSPSALAGVGAQVGQVSMDQCREAAEAVRGAASPHDAREAVRAIVRRS